MLHFLLPSAVLLKKLFIGLLLFATTVSSHSQSIILSTPVSGDPVTGGNSPGVYIANSASTGTTYFEGDDSLQGLAIDKDGAIGFSSTTHEVCRYDAANNHVILGPSITGIQNLAIDPSAEYVYTSYYNSSILGGFCRSVWTDNGDNTSFGNYIGKAQGVSTNSIQQVPFITPGDLVFYNGATTPTPIPSISIVNGMAFDAAGNLYFSDQYHHNIKKISIVSYRVTAPAAKGANTLTLSSVSGIAVGDLVSGMYIPKTTYVTAISGNTITLGKTIAGIITLTTGSIAFITGVDLIAGSASNVSGPLINGPGSSATFNKPMGIVFDPPGNLYIADNGNGKIRKITASGGVINSSSIVSSVSFGYGTDGNSYLTIDESGFNLYVTEQGKNKSIWIVPLLTGLKSLLLGVGNINHTISCTTVLGSSTINSSDKSIIAGMYIKSNTDAGIPVGAKVGTVIAGTSFTLTNFAGVLMNATNSATKSLYFSSADGPLTATGSLSDPRGLALNPLTSELYFIDAGIKVIRKAVLPALFITATSGNWNTGETWQEKNSPSKTSNAYIKDNITVVENCSIADLSVIRGVTITIAAGVTINVSGNLINFGTITGPGKLSLNGVINQRLSALQDTIGIINNLDLNNKGGANGGAFLSGPFIITGLLSVTCGALNANGMITLSSNSTNTASIAMVAANAISGEVTVERFIPSLNRKNYSLVSSPVSIKSIYDTWQESGADKNGYGTQITGASAGNGFDAASAGGIASIYTYDDTKADGFKWVGVTNTKTTIMAPGIGYLLYVRGDRSEARYTTGNSSNTTLRGTGHIKTGDVIINSVTGTNSTVPTLTGVASKFNLIANPYPSAIQWSDPSKVVKSNITPFFWAYDPNLSVFVASNGSVVSPGGGQQQADVIQSGQAFFIQNNATGAPSITFTEAAKVTGVTTSTSATVFGDTTSAPQLNLNVYSTQDSIFADGAVAVYGNTFQPGIAIEDAAKMDNFAETFSLLRDNNRLSIEGRPLIKGRDTLFLNLANFAEKEYSLQIEGKNFNNVTATLEDRFTNTTKALDLKGITCYKFTVGKDTASNSSGRLLITFNSKTIPVIPDPDPVADTIAVPVSGNSLFLKVSPNPVSDQLQVSFKTATIDNTVIHLINSVGQTVKTVDAGKTIAATITIALGNLPAGFYVVQLWSGEKKVAAQKIIIN